MRFSQSLPARPLLLHLSHSRQQAACVDQAPLGQRWLQPSIAKGELLQKYVMATVRLAEQELFIAELQHTLVTLREALPAETRKAARLTGLLALINDNAVSRDQQKQDVGKEVCV